MKITDTDGTLQGLNKQEVESDGFILLDVYNQLRDFYFS
jgi:hypothetical protein